MTDAPAPTQSIPAALERLDRLFADLPSVAIAVSGGVDSLTLAHVASRTRTLRLRVLHAVSPAVPAKATERVRRHAADSGWDLSIVDAREYDDPRYRANPVDRCFHCKTRLYACIRALTDAPIASGTNLDDLGEFRPGLDAARAYGVRHPFVEAGIDKPAVRAIASHLRLDDIAELPAQPCLASRVETGVEIDARDLAFVDAVEDAVAGVVGPGDIRCRVTAEGVRLELAPNLLEPDSDLGAQVNRLMRALCAAQGRTYAGCGPYRRGSAFLVERLQGSPMR